MKNWVLIPGILAISVLLGVGPGAEAQSKSGTKADTKAQSAQAKTDAKVDSKTQHTITGEVTKVDAKKGWVDVKTDEGSMKLHFPPSALQNVKAGDNVTVELGLTRVASAAKDDKATPKTRQ